MREVDNGEKKKKKEKKIMSFIVANNVGVSRPTERQPTGTMTARAKNLGNYKDRYDAPNQS